MTLACKRSMTSRVGWRGSPFFDRKLFSIIRFRSFTTLTLNGGTSDFQGIGKQKKVTVSDRFNKGRLGPRDPTFYRPAVSASTTGSGRFFGLESNRSWELSEAHSWKWVSRTKKLAVDDLAVVVLFVLNAASVFPTALMFWKKFGQLIKVWSFQKVTEVDVVVDMVLYQNHVHVVIPIGCCTCMFLNEGLLLYNLGWPHDLLNEHARPDCHSTCHHSHIMAEIAPITFVCFPPSNPHLNQHIEWHAIYCKKCINVTKKVTNKPGQFFGKNSSENACQFMKHEGRLWCCRIPIARDNVLRFHDVTCFSPLQHQNHLNHRHQPKTGLVARMMPYGWLLDFLYFVPVSSIQPWLIFIWLSSQLMRDVLESSKWLSKWF